MLVRRGVDGGGDHAALGADGEIRRVDREDFIQARQTQDNAAFRRDAAAAEAGAGAAGDDRHAEFVGQLHDRGDFLGRSGQHDDPDRALERGGAVETVRDGVLRRRQHLGGADDFAQAGEEGWGGGGHGAQMSFRASSTDALRCTIAMSACVMPRGLGCWMTLRP